MAWPGSQTPTTIDTQCAWVTDLSGQDLSGLAFDPTNADVLYAVKNKSHVYRLVRTGGAWAKDTANGWSTGKDLRFPGGTGLPDSEGLTVGPDGTLYITTERDNAASGVPLDSVLKFDPTAAGTTLVASDQWVLTSDLGFTQRGRQPGLRGRRLRARQLPDRVRLPDGRRGVYNPAAYPTKVVAGLFFGAVEKTGHLRAYVLKSDHTFERVADIDTGMVGVMDASYDADLGRIWAHCDNTCGNATALLKVGSDGHFAVDHDYSTPTGLPNYNLEGFAVAPVSTPATAPARSCGPTTATGSATRCGAGRSTSTWGWPSPRPRPRHRRHAGVRRRPDRERRDLGRRRDHPLPVEGRRAPSWHRRPADAATRRWSAGRSRSR